MKLTDFRLTDMPFTSFLIIRERSPYKRMMALGRVFPTTKQQATFFIKSGSCLDFVATQLSVDIIEALLTKHGLQGAWQFTKSKTGVRLVNTSDLVLALKAEYLIK